MFRFILLLFFAFLFTTNYAQNNLDGAKNNYLEDQIYLSLTYNTLLNKPSGINQNGFSGGISFGFIKDLPINKKKTFGFGLGFGYSYNAFIQNLKISNVNSVTIFEQAQNYNTNRIGVRAVDFPIEIRWRNSTVTKFKFWRIYGGIKFSYILRAKSIFSDNLSTIITKNISEINRFRYGLTLSAGYSTWNLFVYYGLNSVFKNAVLNSQKIDIKELNIGFKFYIM